MGINFLFRPNYLDLWFVDFVKFSNVESFTGFARLVTATTWMSWIIDSLRCNHYIYIANSCYRCFWCFFVEVVDYIYAVCNMWLLSVTHLSQVIFLFFQANLNRSVFFSYLDIRNSLQKSQLISIGIIW